MCKRCGAPLNTGKVYCSRRCALYAKRAAQRGTPKPKPKPKPKNPALRVGVTSSEYQRNRTTLKTRAQRDNLPCWVCHQPIHWDAPPRTRWSFTADHRTPRSKGGTSALTNLIQAHYGCNSRRGDGTRPPRTEQTSKTSRW